MLRHAIHEQHLFSTCTLACSVASSAIECFIAKIEVNKPILMALMRKRIFISRLSVLSTAHLAKFGCDSATMIKLNGVCNNKNNDDTK